MREHGDEACDMVWESGRRLVGATQGQPFRFPDTIRRLPFHSYSTKKRAYRLFAEIVQCAHDEDYKTLKGVAAQACRWLALSQGQFSAG